MDMDGERVSNEERVSMSGPVASATLFRSTGARSRVVPRIRVERDEDAARTGFKGTRYRGLFVC